MTDARVRVWHDEEGWGILDSAETPGGCWTHFSAIEMHRFRSLSVGQDVILEWEVGEQDGWHHRAVHVTPTGTASAV